MPFEAYPVAPPTAPPTRKRPIGLIVVAALTVVGSIFDILSGVQSITFGWFGVIFLVRGIITLLVAGLMIAGRAYTFVLAWIIAMMVVGIVLGSVLLVQLSPLIQFAGEAAIFIYGVTVGVMVVSVVIYLIIIYYLRRPHVRAFFGRMPMAPQLGAQPVFAPPPPPQPTSFCPSCGTPLQYVPQYQKYWCPNEQKYI